MSASDAPTLDGLVVGRPVDPGDPGAGWLARDLSAGRWVVLRARPDEPPALDPPPDSCPSHPHLLAPRVLSDVHGRSWVVVPFVAGERLDRLGASGGGLSAGQLLSLALPLVAAVAAVHRAGLRLPGLTAADVLVAASGRPLLDGFALLRGPVGGGPEDDVRALVGLLLARLSAADGPLHDLLVSGTAQPPSAVELQRRLARLGPAEPLPVADRPGRGRGPRRRRGAGGGTSRGARRAGCGAGGRAGSGGLDCCPAGRGRGQGAGVRHGGPRAAGRSRRPWVGGRGP
jgi:hypothetical protein